MGIYELRVQEICDELELVLMKRIDENIMESIDENNLVEMYFHVLTIFAFTSIMRLTESQKECVPKDHSLEKFFEAMRKLFKAEEMIQNAH